MSAVSNLTYVWIQDFSVESPEKDSTPVPFSNYNEAMSFAKWASLNNVIELTRVYVWNYNGGSGRFYSGVFTPVENTNWP